MKDQFANYVVQKVLETCSDQQREHILSRIKVHLNALKKYTYGKHIVARVEKLVAAGGINSVSIFILHFLSGILCTVCIFSLPFFNYFFYYLYQPFLLKTLLKSLPIVLLFCQHLLVRYWLAAAD